MKEDSKKKKDIKKKLLHKYRLVVLNEATYEEKISFKLSRLNVFVVGTLFAILLIAFTTLLIAFTPLREYIPGYSSTRLKRQAIELTEKTDSLTLVLNYTDGYIDRLRRVLIGETTFEEVDNDSIQDEFKLDPSSINLSPNKQDSLLREKVALEDKYNFFESDNSEELVAELFIPLSGSLSDTYDAKKNHFAVDIVAPTDSPIKAVTDGVVVLSEWTADTGYVIVLAHKDNLISVYKHNGSLIKLQGEIVKAGEVIATVGNTGEFTTGPHLHFELWKNGYPVNPLNYFDF